LVFVVFDMPEIKAVLFDLDNTLIDFRREAP
jgi:FMN phosphatase YigB (HAD superfamily)